MSANCEKDFTIEVTSLDWTKDSSETPPSVLVETSLSNRFAISLTSGYSPHDSANYFSATLGPYAENRDIDVVGTVNLNGSGVVGTRLMLNLRLKDTPFSVILDASLSKTQADMPFAGPCGFTYELPAGNTAFIDAGLVVFGIGSTSSVDFTVTVTPVVPP